MEILNKKCSKCGEIGGRDNCGFYERPDMKGGDGLRKECKHCFSIAAKMRYCNDTEKYRCRLKLYYAKNANKITARIKTMRKKDPEKYREIDRERYRKDPEKYKARSTKYNRKNYEEVRVRAKKHYEDNREEINLEKRMDRKINPEKHSAYYKKKYEKEKKNPKAMLNRRIHSLVYSSLNGNKNGRKWKILVGYGIEKLEKRLNKTMPVGYGWQNFLNGELHIDHIIPINAFNFTKPEHEDFKKCWALKNLQLLPAIENISKGCKLEKPFQPSLLL